MQISNKRCPYCGSNPVEVLITIGHTSHYECLSCFKTWASEIQQPDIVYGDELNHFGKTGELI